MNRLTNWLAEAPSLREQELLAYTKLALEALLITAVALVAISATASFMSASIAAKIFFSITFLAGMETTIITQNLNELCGQSLKGEIHDPSVLADQILKNSISSWFT